MCELGEASLPAERELDGTSLLPMLKDQLLRRKKSLYWRFNLANGHAKVAIHDGRWKLLALIAEPGPTNGDDLTQQEMWAIKNARLKDFELDYLQADVSESADLSQVEPVALKRLMKQMQAKREGVQKEGPV